MTNESEIDPADFEFLRRAAKRVGRARRKAATMETVS
jgi:hypothetical protein